MSIIDYLFNKEIEWFKLPNHLLSTLRAYSVTAIGVISGIFGILGIKLGLPDDSTFRTEIVFYLLSFFTLYFFIAHTATRAKWAKFYRYSEAYKYLNKGFEEIHELHRLKMTKKTKQNKKLIIASFKKLCTQLSEAFTVITNTKCEVCIKYLVNRDDGTLEYKTLCRNEGSKDIRLKADLLSKQNNVEHSIEKNTSYKEAIHSLENHFLSNKLPFHKDYENTSEEVYDKPPSEEESIKRYFKWPFPYKSTIVVQIIPSHIDQFINGEINPQGATAGFICVDSDRLGTFNEEYDVEILKGVADGIYNTFVKFKEIVDD